MPDDDNEYVDELLETMKEAIEAEDHEAVIEISDQIDIQIERMLS